MNNRLESLVRLLPTPLIDAPLTRPLTRSRALARMLGLPDFEVLSLGDGAVATAVAVGPRGQLRLYLLGCGAAGPAWSRLILGEEEPGVIPQQVAAAWLLRGVPAGQAPCAELALCA